MQKYRIYVTNISHAFQVLDSNGFQATEGSTYVEIDMEPSRKMEVITLLNSAKIVLYDIEEV